MKKKSILIYGSALAVWFSACTTTHQANDSYVRRTQHNKQQPSFIDGIETTPGVVKAKTHKQNQIVAREVVSNKPTSSFAKRVYNTPSTIESATALQIKYALKLNAQVENVTDIPLLAAIDHWWGTPYVMGGSSENGIDCSAFSQIMMRDVFNAFIPRTAQQQFDQSQHLSNNNDLHEGDLVFFGSSRSISHVGIYVMNNKFVHASTSSGVMISDLGEKYWSSHYQGSGRYIQPSNTAMK